MSGISSFSPFFAPSTAQSGVFQGTQQSANFGGNLQGFGKKEIPAVTSHSPDQAKTIQYSSAKKSVGNNSNYQTAVNSR